MLDREKNSQLLIGLLAMQEKLLSANAFIALVARWHQHAAPDLSSLLRKHGLKQEDLDRLESLAKERMKALADQSRGKEDSARTATAVEYASIGPDDTDLVDLVSTASLASSSSISSTAPTSLVHRWGMTSAERFRVLRPHAKGGLGEVFVARDRELNREVALKEIRQRYADQQDSRTRFVLEAEVTGGLEHPGIVPVYGLGQYADGRPFYAMRFIRGNSLNEAIKAFHASDAKTWTSGEVLLKLRELLRRFTDVCNAVEYAHSRGVLHRDLKPANVMLGDYGETLVVDWGLAKIMNRDHDAKGSGGEPSPFLQSAAKVDGTQMGQAVGTAAFMSPEQAAGHLDQLGPASDVYSLGATLYCLLAGQPAFTDKDTATVLEKVRNGEFPRPSAVQPLVPRPLESVCMKAMALLPESRYSSPRALVDDINRWLADESVEAHRESMGERATRLGRRYKAAVRAGTAALLVVATVATVAALMINQQRNRAEALADANGLLADSEREAKENAQLAADRNKRVLDYLVSVFRKPDPEIDGRTVTVASLLERAPEELEVHLASDPLERAAFLDAIGKTLVGLGLYASAVKVDERALTIRQDLLGRRHPDTSASISNLAAACLQAGELKRAVSLYEDLLERTRSEHAPDEQATLSTMNNLAAAYHYSGDWSKAIPLYEDTLRRSVAKLGPDHEDTLSTANNLAVSYQFNGQIDKALELLQTTLEQMRKSLPADHPRALAALNNLASANHAARRWDQAIPLHLEAWNLMRAKLGDDHPDTILSLNNLATCYSNAGQWASARAPQVRAFELSLANLGEDHPHTLLAMHNLGSVYQAAGEIDSALSLLERSLELRRKKLGEVHPLTCESFQAAVDANLELRRFARAAELAEDWREALDAHKEGASLSSARAQLAHAEALLGLAKYASAIEPARSAAEAGAGNYADSVLGGVLSAQGRWTEAESLLLKSYGPLKSGLPTESLCESWRVPRACERIIALYEAQGNSDEVGKWRQELEAVNAEIARLRSPLPEKPADADATQRSSTE